ncbi:MAG: hypothetical protein IPK44_03315 [Candidatus Accumulibacter sp.]|uniref:hypothetical protein n=1 Tax=Accumulibacter sp. TaxID=2053492 RepID=UPI00258DF251|nr:hypothetical protein [Accumulibacter sp.]MBK8113630.1 hypothetical protein [Accumulibacter sp.]
MGQYRLGREESSPIRKIQIMATMKIAGMAANAALTMKTTMEPKDMWMSGNDRIAGVVSYGG